MGWLAAVPVANIAKYFSMPNHLWVSHPCAVFGGLELCELGHVDAVSPTEADDFPKIVIGRETIELDEQILDNTVIFMDEIHPVEPVEKGPLISVMII